MLMILLASCSEQGIQPSAAKASPSATLTNVPTPSPSPEEPFVHQSGVEVITDNAATAMGDIPGNNWGGHQTRIVHTQDGIFTAYILAGGGINNHEWQLVKRQNDGTWLVLAKGNAGRNPVNLLASPDGTLHVIGWPNAAATMWSGKPDNNTLTMTATKIPNQVNKYFPYDSAGIDANGDLCILSSEGGNAPIGWFKWACFIPSRDQWVTQTNKLDYRYAYTYVFPKPNGQLSLISTRDVIWSVLGYQQPAGSFDFVFNAFRYWHTNDIISKPIQQLSFAEETPTEQYSSVMLDARDAYLDTEDRMHILYQIRGASTEGSWKVRHRIVSADGVTLFDGEVPEDAGIYSRIFQTKDKQFYLLGSSGLIYPMDKDGFTFGKPIMLDFNGYQVIYSGFGLSVPRTGTPLSDVMDVVFPATDRTGSAWLYFQLDFSKAALHTGSTTTPSPSLPDTPTTVNSFQEMLGQAKVLFTANLDDKTLPGWDPTWTSASDLSKVSGGNGTLIFNGDMSNGVQIQSPYGLRQNEACLALIRYSGDPDFAFSAVSGEWENSTWRAWGINEGTDSTMPGKHLQWFYSRGQSGNYFSFGLHDVPDRWYYLLLWAADPPNFIVRVWEKDNPDVFYQKPLNLINAASWARRAWHCHLIINSGKVEMGSYQELRFNQAP